MNFDRLFILSAFYYTYIWRCLTLLQADTMPWQSLNSFLLQFGGKLHVSVTLLKPKYH